MDGPAEKPHDERMLEVLPERLGTAAFEEARAAGRAMATADAVAFALGGHVVGSAQT